MDPNSESIARECLAGAENNSMTFPEVVGALMAAGFESYAVDYRCSTATYYLPNGGHVVLGTHRPESSVAAEFDTNAVQAAIREAQTLAPGYTYRGFCEKVIASGCAGYMVSFAGRRVVYYGRTAETHVEHFPV